MVVQKRNSRQSWREAGAQHTSKPGVSVLGRRMVSTAILIFLLLAAVLLVYYVASRRYQHTLVASLFTASRTQTSEPERSFTWLPLRYGSESIAPLQVENTQEFRVASITSSFDNAENLRVAIQEQIDGLERDDAFLLWVRAKGAALDGKAYLLSGDYRLPESAEEISDPQGAVQFKTIVDAVSRWQGPVLILLDWGNQLADARAGMWDNQFLALAVADIEAAPTQVHCLVSHQAGEISLDSLADRQTLFGRACAEALVGPRRAPAGFSPQVQAHEQLLVGDLAEYVVRRVWADSGGTQKPWLAVGGVGWLSAESWQELASSPLVQFGNQRRPLGWKDLPTQEPASEAAPPPAGSSTASQIGIELTEENWPTGPLWKVLDQWQAPSEKLGGWSIASLAPLTTRRLATMVMDLENRWLAGDDFRGGSAGDDLRARIELLRRGLQEERVQIERTSQAEPFSAVFSPRQPDVLPADFTQWRQRLDAVAAYRGLALTLNDTVSLCDSLAKLKDVSGELSRATRDAVDSAQTFLRRVTTSAVESIDSLQPSDAVSLTRQLQSCSDEIETQLAMLVAQVAASPLTQKPLAEFLLRYCWLDHAQRSELLLTMMATDSASSNSAWPTMGLAQLQAEAPRIKQGTTSLWIDLIGAARALAAEGMQRVEVSPGGLVSVLCQTAAILRQSDQFSEATWLIVDGRDLCQKESGWPAQSQQPPLPTVPQPPPGWRLAWENPAGGRLDLDRLQLTSTSEPAKVDLTLSRVGAAENVDSIQIKLSGLQARVAGNDSRWQSGSFQLSQKDLLRVVDLKADAQRLPLEIKSLSGDSNSKLGLEVIVQAGNTSPPAQTLVCLLPVATPVELVVQQLTCREGLTAWENCERQAELFTIRPFPGRKTEFRLLVTNQDNQARVATVELYRLTARASTNAKGRISETGGEIPLQLENQSLRSLAPIAKSSSISLEPNQRDAIVDFSSSAAQPGTAAAESATTGVAGGTSTAANADISWGVLAVVRLESEPTKAWRTWIQLKPMMGNDFLTASSTTSRDLRTIELEIGLRDVNRNNLPDLTPTDFSEEQPIVVECEIGDGIELEQATLTQRQHKLTKDMPRQSFTISAERKIEDEVELQISVDGAPRALFEFVGVGGRAARREPPDRLQLRSIGAKDGLTYITKFRQNLSEKERLLGNAGAMFRRPVTGPIEIVLAVDVQSRGRADAAPEPFDLRLVGPTWEHDFGRFFGDRDLYATLVGAPGETLSVNCQLTDWTFIFDPSSIGDASANLRGSVAQSGERQLAKLVLDGLGPIQFQSVEIKDVIAGQTSQLSFQVVENVPIGQGKIMIGRAGQAAQAQLGSPLSANDFTPSANGWKLSNRSLPVQDLPAGLYDVRVEIEDILGNTSNLGPWTLNIIQNARSAQGGQTGSGQPLKGTINGRLFFGNAKNKPPNPVTVAIKELPEKSTTSNDGKYTIPDVEAGEYTLEAKTLWQGMTYKGEVKVKLAKKPDYQQLFDISLAK